MPLALTGEHQALAAVARSFLADRAVPGEARARLDAPDDAPPPSWTAMVELGWPGLHLPDAHGGQGYGLAELVVVLEELGRVVAPGPFLPTVWASAVLAAAGSAAQQDGLLRALADGSCLGAVGLEVGGRVLALGGAVADVLVLPTGDDLVVVEAGAAGLAVEAGDGLDPTRRVAAVHWSGSVTAAARIVGGRAIALRLGRLLAAAEAVGIAAAATDAAVAYAKVREQFGRPIGSFQAVKHHCADMLVDTELAVAATWDAARAADRAAGASEAEASLAAAVAASLALPAARRAAERSIQVHGGIGYTWEHDAHLLLRRAATLDALFDAAGAVLDDVARLRAAGVGAGVAIELPPEAAGFREEARAFRRRHDALPAADRRAALIDAGYLVPHWPAPWSNW